MGTERTGSSATFQESKVADYDRTTKASEMLFRSFAWTHVFRIYPKRGNPKVKLIKAQIELNTLKDEIASLRPDVVLFFHRSRLRQASLESIVRRKRNIDTSGSPGARTRFRERTGTGRRCVQDLASAGNEVF